MANMNSFMTSVCESEGLTNPFKKHCPFKTKRTDLAYEINYLDVFVMNYQKYMMKHISKE